MFKRNLLKLFCLLLLTGIGTRAFAVAESEPNNTWNQADVITLGATGTGGCPTTDEDWWRVTSTVDGKLTVNFTATNSIYVYCEVYDTLGAILVSTSTYTSSSSVVNVDGLAAGTYYIKFRAYNAATSPTYSFQPSWTTPAQTIDAEPNETRNQAKPLALNGSVTGHIGYYFYNKRDTADWWKVTTNKDGQLYFTLTSNNGQYVYAQLFDNDGVTYLAGSYTSSTSTWNYDGLAVGTYYIKVFGYSSSVYSPYTLSNTLTLPPCVIDVEPNQTQAQALTINVGDSLVGHVGYYYNHYRDTIDWYKVTTAKDGQLNYKISSLNGNYIYLYLYDNDGVTLQSGGSYTSGTATFTTDGLAAGTYYLAVFSYNNSQFEPYSIKLTQTLPPCVIDAEPNGTRALAHAINLNDSLTGHVGYYYNHQRDSIDWYKITTTLDGQLNYKISSLNGYYIFLQLYDNNGTTNLGGNYTSGTYTWNTDGLAAGTYYLAVYSYNNTQFEPYSIKVTQTLPSVTIDAEPNDKKSQAKTINLNDSITGHVGYLYNNKRDTFDYRKITLTSDGRLDWTISSQNGYYIYAQLFDNNGTTLLAGNYTSTTTTFSKDGLAAGTYYLLIYSYNSTQFEPYYLKTKFYPSASDPEPNGTYATAATLNLNDSLKGNTSYYYNGARDTTDWFRITTNNDGQLNIKLYSLNGNYIYLTVYDNDGSTILYGPSYSTTSLAFTKNDAGKGTYYVRVNAYSVNNFVPYALVNSLINNNPNDPEPDNYAKNANKINGYSTRTGNINYYYDGAKDGTDWFKLGYYSLGNLDITITKVQHTFDANYPDILYRLYKDTTLAPLDSIQLLGNSPAYNHSYTAFAAGTFYVRITQLNNTFGGYSIKANYKDTTSQTVTLVSDVAGTTCGAGALTYYITRGKPPYSVQLYKDGVASGSAVNTSDTAKFTSLDAGYYTVTTRSTTAATYTASGKDTTVVPKPAGLATASVTTTSAILKWTGLSCVDGYKLQWRLKGTTTWATIYQPAGATQDTINGLTASAQYQFRVYAYVLYTGTTKYYGLVSAIKTFTTPAVRIADNTDNVVTTEMEVYPNPVLDKINFVVDDASQAMQITISNSIGQQVMVINNNIDLSQAVDVSSLKQGIYFVTIKTSVSLYTSRFVKE